MDVLMRPVPPSSESIEPACPHGCPKEKANLQHSYRDIHAPAPPRGCVDCIRKELNHPEHQASRPCPPGTKPIPERPMVENEAFLNTFDCQEQPRRSSTHMVESHHDYGCEDLWKPTIRSGKMTSDNLGEFGHHQDDQEWRSSRTYIPCAHDYGRSQSWRPCIKLAGGDKNNSCENNWRPSVHIAGPPEGDSEKPHINCIRVPASYSTTWKETSSPQFRPSHRYIPATVPERNDWKISKGHVCSRQCVHQLPDSAYIHGQMFDDSSERNTEGIHTAKKLIPFKKHPCNCPSYCLPVDDPSSVSRLFQDAHPPAMREEHRGKKFIPPMPEDGACTPRLPHTGCTLRASCSPPDQRRELPCRKGRVEGDKSSTVCGQKEYDIFEPMVRELQIQPLPHVERDEHKPLAPQGRFNEYVIDGYFHGFKQPEELLTEQKAQFTTTEPWLRKEIFNDMIQASRENKHHCWNVSPSIIGHLYEDRDAVVR